MPPEQSGTAGPGAPLLSRRRMLSMAAAAASVPSFVLSSEPARATEPMTPVDSVHPTAPVSTQALLLARRATYGPTPGLLAELGNRGPVDWLERQLDPRRVPDPIGTALARIYPEAGWTIAQVYREIRAGRVERFSWDVMLPLGQYSLAMAAWSTRQLHELMVEFWSNHLNVTNPSDGVWDNRQDYDRRVIRAHALGRFSDMLAASAAHPAMLAYLNQGESTKDAPNENYGRELLELHTVGVDAGYTEAMVLDSARIMTGYTLQWEESSPRFREFAYDPSIHWTGRVRVLGFADRNAERDGRTVAREYLRYLARHPATARTIARKLAVRFVSDSPSAGLVNRLADIYRSHDTDIVPVLRALFTSSEFRSSEGEKVRRPYEDLIGTLRALDYRLLAGSAGAPRQRSGPEALYWIASSLGQAPLAWSSPDGYPDVAPAWASAGGLLERWNMHQGLAGGWWPAKDRIAVPDLQRLLPRRLTTYAALIDHLATRVTGSVLPARDTAAVLAFLGRSGSAPVRARDAAVTWDLVRLVALILDTANHQVR